MSKKKGCKPGEVKIDGKCRMDIMLPTHIEHKLRNEAFKQYKGKKGSLSKIVSDAIEFYVDNKDEIDSLKAQVKTLENKNRGLRIGYHSRSY
jgi:hypothetical protein